MVFLINNRLANFTSQGSGYFNFLIFCMTRVTRGFVARKRRNKILSSAKGFRAGHSRLFRSANQQVMKAQKYSFADRRKKKTMFRRLWIRRINASVRPFGISYGPFISGMKKRGILLNRKSLAQMALLEPTVFQQVVTSILD
jgi:large subunit ribosomal protein L20